MKLSTYWKRAVCIASIGNKAFLKKDKIRIKWGGGGGGEGRTVSLFKLRLKIVNHTEPNFRHGHISVAVILLSLCK